LSVSGPAHLPELLKARIVEPEDTAVIILYKHICDMEHDDGKAGTVQAKKRLRNCYYWAKAR
jgi:hypothetical protein